jgi:hypothetical protein
MLYWSDWMSALVGPAWLRITRKPLTAATDTSAMKRGRVNLRTGTLQRAGHVTSQ